jgi:hypothetical protein
MFNVSKLILGRRYMHQLKAATLQSTNIWVKKSCIWVVMHMLGMWKHIVGRCSGLRVLVFMGRWMIRHPWTQQIQVWCWQLIYTDHLCKVPIFASNSMSFIAFLLFCALAMVKYSSSSTPLVFYCCLHSTDGKTDTPPLHHHSDCQSPLHSARLKLGFQKI